MIVKMIKEFERRMDTEREDRICNTELENIKSNQIEMKNNITEMKKTLEGINSRLDDTVEWISKIEERAAEITQPEQKKKREKVFNEDTLREL